MGKLTPRPWEIEDDTGYGSVPGTTIMGPDGFTVVLAIGDMDHIPAKANAEFIVKAANAHEVLLAALKTARIHLRTLRGDVPNDPYADRVDKAVFAEIDNALATESPTHES